MRAFDFLFQDREHAWDEPVYMLVPVNEDDLGSANYEMVRNLAQDIIPLLRQLHKMNWQIKQVGK